MNLKDIRKLEISKSKYEFMLACNEQHQTQYKFFIYNGRYFNTTKLEDKKMLDFINSLKKINGLKANEYLFNLGTPFWSAWKHFNWTPGVEGFGVRDKICEEVISKGFTLVVQYKDTKYRITSQRLREAIDQYKSYFQVNPNVRLVILPRFVFRRSVKRKKIVPVVKDTGRKLPVREFINLALF